MKVYKPAKLEALYEYSADNGFTDIWVPKSSGFLI